MFQLKVLLEKGHRMQSFVSRSFANPMGVVECIAQHKISQFRAFLERKFFSGNTWENAFQAGFNFEVSVNLTLPEKLNSGWEALSRKTASKKLRSRVKMDLNQSWYIMMFLALTLGVRHGFDLDHLATIDAISRIVRKKRLLSKMVGFLFSLGHGFIVTLVSIIIGTGIIQTHAPVWLEAFGNWISIIFLFVFGLLNLWNLFHNPSNPALPVGIKSLLVKKYAHKNFSPAMILLVGALFAFSFDTFSQVALFSISASLIAGWVFSCILGLTFTIGMMCSDGLNGLFVSTILQRADRLSLFFSWTLGLAISLFSLTIGSISLYKALSS